MTITKNGDFSGGELLYRAVVRDFQEQVGAASTSSMKTAAALGRSQIESAVKGNLIPARIRVYYDTREGRQAASGQSGGCVPGTRGWRVKGLLCGSPATTHL